jgi:hypothetical protein
LIIWLWLVVVVAGMALILAAVVALVAFAQAQDCLSLRGLNTRLRSAAVEPSAQATETAQVVLTPYSARSRQLVVAVAAALDQV